LGDCGFEPGARVRRLSLHSLQICLALLQLLRGLLLPRVPLLTLRACSLCLPLGRGEFLLPLLGLLLVPLETVLQLTHLGL
jgi:hypothetical protein